MIDKEKQERIKDGKPTHFNLDDKSVDELVLMTKGYSGSDLANLSKEAAMMPLRGLDDIVNADINNIRPLGIDDFKEGLINVRPSVKGDDLEKFMDWNNKFGSFPVTEEDLKD